MADGSAIEWTDATWNPVRGCTRISAGCGGPNRQGGCYAETIAARFSGPGQPFEGFAERGLHGGRWTGKMALVDEALTLPLRWKKPRRIFVNSMSDLFHENLPDEAIDKVFAVMALAPQHTFQVLTKRAQRMREYVVHVTGLGPRFSRWAANSIDIARAAGAEFKVPARWPLPNVWLGVSTEDQATADERIPHLLATPSAKRFISAEPLLGAIDIEPFVCVFCKGTRWVEDQNWSPPDYASIRTPRQPRDGLIICAQCNLGGQAELTPVLGGLDWVIAGAELDGKLHREFPT